VSVGALLSKDLIETRERLGSMYATAKDSEIDTLEAVDDLLRQALALVVAAHPPSAEAALVASGIPADWAAMAADHR